jgi:hypothetical protein
MPSLSGKCTPQWAQVTILSDRPSSFFSGPASGPALRLDHTHQTTPRIANQSRYFIAYPIKKPTKPDIAGNSTPKRLPGGRRKSHPEIEKPL